MKAPTALWVLLAVGLCVVCGSCGHSGADVVRAPRVDEAPDSTVTLEGEAWWRDLRDAEAPLGYDEYKYPTHYWMDVLKAAHGALWSRVLRAEDGELRYVLSRFGTSGCQADFKLMFCDPYLTVYQGNFTAWPLTRGRDGVSSEEFSALRGKVARFQVEHFWNDRAALDRYCHALMWCGVLRPGQRYDFPLLASHTATGLASRDDNEFWYNARNVLVCAAVTDRLDLIRGLAPAEIREGFAGWHTWFRANYDWLVFDKRTMKWKVDREATTDSEGGRPTQPFPDWDGPPPPRSDLIRVYQADCITK